MYRGLELQRAQHALLLIDLVWGLWRVVRNAAGGSAGQTRLPAAVASAGVVTASRALDADSQLRSISSVVRVCLHNAVGSHNV